VFALWFPCCLHWVSIWTRLGSIFVIIGLKKGTSMYYLFWISLRLNVVRMKKDRKNDSTLVKLSAALKCPSHFQFPENWKLIWMQWVEDSDYSDYTKNNAYRNQNAIQPGLPERRRRDTV
jgi:hypothetical protein